MPPPGAAGASRTLRHCLWVVGACVLGVGVVAAVVLGTVPAGAVVVGTPTRAVVVGAGPDLDVDVVDVAGAQVAGGADLSAPATTTPTEVLAPGRGRLPSKLASGCLATASTPVIAATAIPKATTAATATRCQRIGCGSASHAPSSLAPACSPTRRTRERRATRWADQQRPRPAGRHWGECRAGGPRPRPGRPGQARRADPHLWCLQPDLHRPADVDARGRLRAGWQASEWTPPS
jgi:hypothetical protein